MPISRTDYLNLSVLLKAERNGQLAEQLDLQRNNTGSSGLKTESYCMEFVKMKKDTRAIELSVNDVKRKEFHTNY